MFALDSLFHLPDVWYCSDLVSEAFLRAGIELEVRTPMWDASDDRETRDHMFFLRGEATRRFGEVDGERYLRGFELPEEFLSGERRCRSAARAGPTLNSMVRSSSG